MHFSMMEHLKYYAERIEAARLHGQRPDWLAREFCRDFGRHLTVGELERAGLLSPFLTPKDFGKKER